MESYFEDQVDGDEYDEAAFGENPPVLILAARQIRDARNVRGRRFGFDDDRTDEARMHDAEEPSLFRFQDEEEIMSYDDWA